MNYELIKQEMQYEIDNPQRGYLPNSPGAFIRDRLFKKMEWDAAVWFWDGYCRGGFSIPELDLMLHKVKALAAHEKMPDWGTYGT
jgi:hypothetical protein